MFFCTLHTPCPPAYVCLDDWVLSGEIVCKQDTLEGNMCLVQQGATCSGEGLLTHLRMSCKDIAGLDIVGCFNMPICIYIFFLHMKMYQNFESSKIS